MSVSGTMAISKATLVTGSGAIGTQRGNDTWGANYVFSAEGLQNDIYQISETVKTGGIVASGTQYIGSASTPIAVSGIYMNGPAGVPYRLVILANGLVSGVAA
jgi:hypothetical protein